MFVNVKKKFSIIICCRPIPMPFLSRSFTAALPCFYPRKVVSHFLAGMNLSSCKASHHNPPHLKSKKHRKTLTTQAGFLLSEDQPLTVLGSSMMLHHCLRLRDLSMGIISLWWFSLSELWNIYSHLSRVFFYLLITFPQNVLYTLNTHPAQPILCPVPWKTHYESFEVLEIISWGTGNTR